MSEDWLKINYRRVVYRSVKRDIEVRRVAVKPAFWYENAEILMDVNKKMEVCLGVNFVFAYPFGRV